MRGRERQLWTEFVRKREEPARKRRSKKPPRFSPAELEAALDDLIAEYASRTDAKR